MNLKHMYTFVEVAQCKSFSLAATRLHTVQSAVSRHINALESSLNVKLFERTTRYVELTAPGKVFLRHVEDILAHYQQAQYETQRVANGKQGLLRIGYLSSACAHFMPELLKRFSLSEPLIDVQIFEMTAAQQLEAFSEGRIDIGFSRPIDGGYSGLINQQHLTDDPIVLVVSEAHPLSKNSSVNMADLAPYPLTLFAREQASSLFDAIISAFHRVKVQPKVSNEPSSMQALLTHIASTQHVALVPSCIKNLQTQGCEFISLTMPLSVPLEMHWQANGVPVTETWISWCASQTLAF
ncbi:LysR family transcriptional regulator [Alteromonas sp. CI.11.F.A3]|uniref:LysR substrate-binding domain-containing protein n=1 Tax=Alteromonas sp. CI.11.F.A3 TaxID=3079555 RepID=UPI0029428675|nr:LysR family transcriptional regulator [Alteromonas sp. CI.11.F.A3]WOI36045.1 LysR family transcriptional regulator [Alteromonas sp. CI.11.F.A3]